MAERAAGGAHVEFHDGGLAEDIRLRMLVNREGSNKHWLVLGKREHQGVHELIEVLAPTMRDEGLDVEARLVQHKSDGATLTLLGRLHELANNQVHVRPQRRERGPWRCEARRHEAARSMVKLARLRHADVASLAVDVERLVLRHVRPQLRAVPVPELLELAHGDAPQLGAWQLHELLCLERRQLLSPGPQELHLGEQRMVLRGQGLVLLLKFFQSLDVLRPSPLPHRRSRWQQQLRARCGPLAPLPRRLGAGLRLGHRGQLRGGPPGLAPCCCGGP
mmetsp:Transcript_5374/g.20311  ORF Transcript_5374/g.20311 Transcript_5374/m.20311 type:complete len:277 (-) Transcript_5374:627-1457(-)